MNRIDKLLSDRLRNHIVMATISMTGIALLAIFDVIHYAIWIPGLIANIGLVVSLGMQLNALDDKER